MLKRKFTFIILITACFHVNSQEPEFKWSREAKVSSYNAVYDVATDKQNNIYCVGHCNGDFQFYDYSQGTEPFNGRLQEFFITKFDANGQYQWIRMGGGAGYETAGTISIDKDNNILVGCVSESGEMYIENDTIQNSSYITGFIVKYNPSGLKLWSKQIGTGGHEFWPQIRTDSNNNIYVLTRINDTSAIHKINSAGSTIWTVKLPNAYASSIAFKLNDIYLVGYSTKDSLFIGQTLVAKSKASIILKLDSDGNLLSSADYSGITRPSKLLVDKSGNIFVTGSYSGILTVNSTTVAQTNNLDMFIIKLDSTYKLAWGKGLATNGVDWVMGSTIAQNGDVILSGTINGTNSPSYPSGCNYIFTNYGGRFYLAQISSNDGSIKWEKKSNETNTYCGSFASCVFSIPNSNDLIIGGYTTQAKVATDDFLFSNGGCFISGTSDEPVSLKEHDLNNIILYPNPCKNDFTVDTEQPTRLKITNTLGEIVFEDSKEQFSRIVDVRIFMNGVYFVTVFSKYSAIQRKIIVGDKN